MAKHQVPICLKQPDKIQLVYGDHVIAVDMGDFTRYTVVVDEDQLPDFEPYLCDRDHDNG